MSRQTEFTDDERALMLQYYTQRRPLRIVSNESVCRELADAYGVHWKTIEREIRKARRSGLSESLNAEG